jgi:hypothetical protein
MTNSKHPRSLNRSPMPGRSLRVTSDRRRITRNRRSLAGQDPPVALIKCLPRSGRSHCNQKGVAGAGFDAYLEVRLG